jgi:hypothetical protein
MLSALAVARVVKKLAERAGLDPANYAGHSVRAGELDSVSTHLTGKSRPFWELAVPEVLQRQWFRQSKTRSRMARQIAFCCLDM